ncbi:hypothetical protein [Parafilimonas sp.]|uniref:hypothetical protein n=1 Tax=Parafilimonas sp. TaxID=1969739 RepID=UPI003F7D46EE
MISINYSYFFRIELLHKYFANNLCNDFIITPSAETQAAIKGNKMLAKQYGNTLYTALQTDDDNKAFMVPSDKLQLTFFMQLNSGLFYNYTNLPSVFKPGKLYYFSNRNNNAVNGKKFISQSVLYDNNKDYVPGDIAIGGGTIYQCIKGCKNVTPSDANDTNWMKIDKNQYVSEQDAVQWMPSISTYTFETLQPDVTIDAWAFNLADNAFSHHVISESIAFKDPAKQFKLDLSSLAPGKYKLKINSNEQFIYINDALSARPVFGVIEIFNDSSIAPPYQLLNGDVLNSPVYTINFLNRATIWKYILKNTSKGKITITPAGFDFPATASDVIISQSPIPLNETPLNVSLALTVVDNDNVNITVPDVACPSPSRLTSFTNGPDKYACSEVFLNH